VRGEETPVARVSVQLEGGQEDEVAEMGGTAAFAAVPHPHIMTWEEAVAEVEGVVAAKEGEVGRLRVVAPSAEGDVEEARDGSRTRLTAEPMGGERDVRGALDSLSAAGSSGELLPARFARLRRPVETVRPDAEWIPTTLKIPLVEKVAAKREARRTWAWVFVALVAIAGMAIGGKVVMQRMGNRGVVAPGQGHAEGTGEDQNARESQDRGLCNPPSGGQSTPANTEVLAACDRLCRSGSLQHCVVHGVWLQKRGDEQVEREAAELFRRGCNGGVALGCGRLGRLYYYGKGGLAKDLVMVVSLSKQACSGGDALSCSSLGFMYESGEGGLKKDPERAVALYKQA
jgi:hypothetical protein